jgi:transglutaminase-like putative cysteine protease
MIRYLSRLVLNRTWLLLLFLVGALSSAWYGLSQIISGMERVPWALVLVLGILVGWALAASHLKTPWAVLAMLLLGIFFSAIFFAHLGQPALAFLRSSLLFSKELWHWDRSILPESQPLFLAWQEIWMSLTVLFFHLGRWAASAWRDEWVVNPMATGLLWSLFFWLTAAWAAWAVRRYRNPLAGLAPIGVLLAFLLNYTGGEIYSLLGFIGSLLFLMAFTLLDANELRWVKLHTDFASDISFDLGVTATLLTAVVVLLAAAATILPTTTLNLIEDLTNRWRYGSSEDDSSIARSLGIEPHPERVMAMSAWVKGGLPREHLLGSGPELSQRVVMTIQVLGQPARMGETGETAPPNYYWRSLTYDQYNLQGWNASYSEETAHLPKSPLSNVADQVGTPVTVKIDTVEDLGGLLYAPGELVTADHNFIVAKRPVPQPREGMPYGPGNAVMDIFGAKITSAAYLVEALQNTPSIVRLRTTSYGYPDWIRKRYLDLPTTLPDRVISLALDLTRDAYNPYDKAVAIETYLRTIPYTLDIPAPPLGRDVVDYFLFDLKKGYCDYYATAMAILARAAGLPSRVVVGYASGSYDPANNRYVVTEADAHSWVEIYFTGRGWVEFEPTASLPLIPLPEDTGNELQASLTGASEANSPKVIDWPLVLNKAGLTLVLVIVLLLLTQQIDSLRLKRMPPQVAIQKIFRRLYRRSRPLTGQVTSSLTPNEFADLLQDRVQEASRILYLKDTLYPIPSKARGLTKIYNQALYSLHPPSRPEIKTALQSWHDLRWRLWLSRFRPHSKGRSSSDSEQT